MVLIEIAAPAVYKTCVGYYFLYFYFFTTIRCVVVLTLLVLEMEVRLEPVAQIHITSISYVSNEFIDFAV